MILRILVEVVSNLWGVLFATVAFGLFTGGVVYSALRILEEARLGERREEITAFAAALVKIAFGYAFGKLYLLAAVNDPVVAAIGGILAVAISVVVFVNGWRDGDIPYLFPDRPLT